MSTLLYEKKGRIVIITINRPEVKNCLDPETDEKMASAWRKFKDDDEALVAIITGAGNDSFCSGADLKAWPSFLKQKDAHYHRRRAYDGPGFGGITRGIDIFKPILAAINGYCFAGGLEIALAADLRIAAENAEFGCLERRWNVGLGDGGTQRLWRIIGLGRAMELIITGKRINAQEALAIGLVNEVVPQGLALPRCLELAEMISQFPQGALRTDKEALLRGIGEPLTEGLRIEAMLFNTLIGTHDFHEGPRAFTEKRSPIWKND
ncbi:MAG: enoyl-CoA hydratase/isomerase family protein [Thermodesulfobacteriota bacterium]